MALKDLQLSDIDQKKMLNDDQYFKYIFKKTEKIYGVVLYIGKSESYKKDNSQIMADIEMSARELHQSVSDTLGLGYHQVGSAAHACAHRVLALDSQLQVAVISQALSPEVVHVLSAELDSVLRTLMKYTNSNMSLATDTKTPLRSDFTTTTVRQAVPKIGQKSVQLPVAKAKKANRREQILDVLRDRGSVSISDISDIITDCSEKTIQRELSFMIKNDLVKKTGERRWSKYTLNK